MKPILVLVRQVWRRLTSMRTALILLFLLAVAAVPGSLLPQRVQDPGKTSAYITAHGAWGRFLNSIDMFDVFGSVWFAAIYLLLAVSLVGCLIPRIKLHARAVVRRPLRAPRNLARLPESGRFVITDTPEDYATSARSTLGRRWRVERRVEDSGALTLSAEKGFIRESGNLIFHVSILVALVLIAIGQLYQYSGQVIVKQGSGFCNAPGVYDQFNPGRLAAEGKVAPAPFCVTKLDKFIATYQSGGEPLEFQANITYQPNAKAAHPQTKTTSITVNHPLRLQGDRLYLQGHGYAPTITLKMPGQAPITDTEVFLPSNATTLLSEGVFAENGPVGGNSDIGIKGSFAPDAVPNASGALTSVSAQTSNPELSVLVYKGSLNQNGLARNVYTIDTSKMKKIDAANLSIGQTITLPGGGTLTYDGFVPWVNFQISHDPTQGYLLFTAGAMVLGLFASLTVRRRRLWIRIAPAADGPDRGPTVVTVGGLARSDSGNFTSEFATLLTRLSSAATPADEGNRSIDAVTLDYSIGSDDPIGAGKGVGMSEARRANNEHSAGDRPNGVRS